MPMPMNQSMMPYFMQMMQGGGGMGGGMPTMQNNAPQIPMAQPSQGAGQMPQPQQQQPQQQGFFGNMMSSPLQMQAGSNLMGQAGRGISSLFGGGGTADTSAALLANPATNPFTGAAGLTAAGNTAGFLGAAGGAEGAASLPWWLAAL